MSTYLRARWLLPIDRPPIHDGWVEVVEGRVAALGRGRPPGRAHDLGDRALMPGLVNAHTHLELSWMAGLVPPAPSMPHWIRSLLDLRRVGPGDGASAERQAAETAVAAARASGTVLLGDVSNTLAASACLRQTGLGGVIFHEVLGFRAVDPEGLVRDAWQRVRTAGTRAGAMAADDGTNLSLAWSVVAHAPYSVSPALFRAIAAHAGAAPLTVHVGESPEELELLDTGRGPMRLLLDDLGAWSDDWVAPGCGPIEYLASVGYLRPGVLAVHGVYLSDEELAHLAEAGGVLVTCPRSNVWVGAGPPPLARFYQSGVPVAVGTDSLASAPTLNLFDELAEMRRIAPEVPAASLIDSVTRVGASALGFGRDFGTMGIGKRAVLTGVDVPPDVADVEEYLVGGVPAASVRPVTV